MAIKKVVINNQVKLDLTQDTVSEQDVVQNKTFHNNLGLQKFGSKPDIVLTNDTVEEQYVTQGKTFHNAQGIQKTGTKLDIDISNDTITAEDVLNNKTFHGANGQLQTGTAVQNEPGYESIEDALEAENDIDRVYYKEYMGIDTWSYTSGNFIMIGNEDGVTHSEMTNPSSSNLAVYNKNDITSDKLLTILNEFAINDSIIPTNQNLVYDRDSSTWSWIE